MTLSRLCLFALFCLPSLGFATATPVPSSQQTGQLVRFAYHPDRVYQLTLHVGYATVIQFAPDEQVLTPTAGTRDLLGITQPKSNQLVLKPQIPLGNTNLIINTRRKNQDRTYIFVVKVDSCAEICSPEDIDKITLRVSFTEPRPARASRSVATRSAPGSSRVAMASPPAAGTASPTSSVTPDATANTSPQPDSGPKAPEVVAAVSLPPRPKILTSCDPAPGINRAYVASGDDLLKPKAACDNGTFMRFEFDRRQRWPVPYAVDLRNRKEQLVNHRREGNALIIEGLYDLIVFRFDQAFVCVFDTTRVSSTTASEINQALKNKPPE
jgi:type IV secretory pathway VirB9-like protein